MFVSYISLLAYCHPIQLRSCSEQSHKTRLRVGIRIFRFTTGIKKGGFELCYNRLAGCASMFLVCPQFIIRGIVVVITFRTIFLPSKPCATPVATSQSILAIR